MNNLNQPRDNVMFPNQPRNAVPVCKWDEPAVAKRKRGHVMTWQNSFLLTAVVVLLPLCAAGTPFALLLVAFLSLLLVFAVTWLSVRVCRFVASAVVQAITGYRKHQHPE